MNKRVLAMSAFWNAAAENWDSAALSALYTEDALLLGGRAEQSIGQNAICAYFESYRGVILSASVDMVDQHILETGPASLFAQGFCHFAFTLSDDRQTVSRLRTSWLLDWSSDNVRIRAHHFSSVPTVPPLGQ